MGPNSRSGTHTIIDRYELKQTSTKREKTNTSLEHKTLEALYHLKEHKKRHSRKTQHVKGRIDKIIIRQNYSSQNILSRKEWRKLDIIIAIIKG